jgi:alkanesulfonate monooxygenase SsuD/methylene tetrahydromethanopterin reductase-like flavin-dependent oxidoreductase (luciferase family)
MTLGLLMTGSTYRQPGLLAKIVTTPDVVSAGRAQLGIGAARYEREHLGLGIPFSGAHYLPAETICSPRPVSSWRP